MCWVSNASQGPDRQSLCKGKSFTEDKLHGNQEESCEEEKETLTVSETIPRKNPRDYPKSLPGEAPPVRLFDFVRRTAARLPPTTNSGLLSTNWGCSETCVVLETAEAGILAFPAKRASPLA